jgi:hypothetical protein
LVGWRRWIEQRPAPLAFLGGWRTRCVVMGDPDDPKKGNGGNTGFWGIRSGWFSQDGGGSLRARVDGSDRAGREGGGAGRNAERGSLRAGRKRGIGLTIRSEFASAVESPKFASCSLGYCVKFVSERPEKSPLCQICVALNMTKYPIGPKYHV